MANEMVLYYTPVQDVHVTKVKGVFVRMGAKIRNISPEQINEKVGYLAGLPGFEAVKDDAQENTDTENNEEKVITEDVIVLKNFSDRKINELVYNLKKSGVPIALKAVLTQQNSQWTFYHLYEQLKQEHEVLSKKPEES